MITLLKLSPYTGDIVAPSPNHDARKAPGIEGIVLHATQDAGDEAVALSWLRSPRSHVSCHLLVGRDGHVTRLVGDRERAWHAGLSRWHGTTDVNSITLGIEIANRNDGERYSDAQYRKVADIVAHYCGQGLTLDDIVSHAEIAEGRKADPVGWDWDRFRTLVLLRTQPVEEAPVIVATTPPPAQSVQRLPNAPASPAIVAPPAHSAQVTVVPKHVLESRTFWLNLVTALAGGGILLNDALDVVHRVGIHLPEDVTKWALFLVGIMNIILRWRTSRPITCSDGVHCSPPKVQKPVIPSEARNLHFQMSKVQIPRRSTPRDDARAAAAYAARSSRKALPVG